MKKNYNMSVYGTEEILDILKRLEIYEDILSGNLRCYFCNKQVIPDEIIAVFTEEDEIQICCNDHDCYSKLFKKKVFTNDN